MGSLVKSKVKRVKITFLCPSPPPLPFLSVKGWVHVFTRGGPIIKFIIRMRSLSIVPHPLILGVDRRLSIFY